MEPIDIFEQQMKIEKAELESLTRPVRWIIEIYEFFRYRFIPRITEAPREIKWKLQRLFRGYSDADVWGLNYFIIEKIRPALKAFVKYQEEQGHSLPMDFANNPAAWLVVLKKIEYAFDYVWKDQNDVSSWSVKKTSEEIVEENRKVSVGFQLFGRYVMSLWD